MNAPAFLNASLVLMEPEPGLPADEGRPMPKAALGLFEELGRPNDDDVGGLAPDPPRGSLDPEGRGEPTSPP